MRLRLSSRGIELGAAQREQLDRMVRQALNRHASRIATVAVTLLPSSRMHGVGLTCCRIRIRLRDGRGWIAEEHASDPRQAAFGASTRMEGRFDRERSLLPLERPPLVLAR